MTGNWFCLDEKVYESFCKVQMNDNTVSKEDLDIIMICSSLNVTNLKERLIFDLFYQAIIFSKNNGFHYNDAKFLITTIERELRYLIQTNSEENYHNSAYQRFLKYVTESRAMDSIKDAASVKELPAETEKLILLHVQTPIIPVPLT